MKLKKLIAAAASVVMACVFATSAFAATTQEKRERAAAQFPDYAYVINDMNDTQVEWVAARYTFDSAVAEANSVMDRVKADPGNAKTIVQEAVRAVAIPGFDVTDVKVTTHADGSITATVTVINNQPLGGGGAKNYDFSTTLLGTQTEHPEIGEAIKNGTWGVDENKAAAASTVTGAGKGVIKATGDNSAVVLVMGALAIAGVLGLAVRKNGAEA